MKHIKKSIWKTIAAMVISQGAQCAQGADESIDLRTKPNILLILADDMGWSDPGFLGGDIETPNLDRLAREGSFYPRFYNHAKCEPSRASLLTGVHFHRQTQDHVVRTVRGVGTIASELKKAGYFTACAGKWHTAGVPTERGFARYFGMLEGAGNHFDPGRTLGLDPACYLKQEYALDGKPFVPDGKSYYSTDAYTDYAIQFLKERQEGKPFFLYLAYRSPHWPLQAPEEVIQKYVDRYTGGWDELRSARAAHIRQAGVFSPGWKLPPRDPDVCNWADWPKQADAARCMAVHAAMVDRMDQQIGRVLDYLKEIGELDNTLICFTSDNGVSAEMQFDRTPDKPAGAVDSFRVLPLGFCNAVNTPFVKYKTYNSNGGICSPLIVRWPGRVPSGTVNHRPVNILDMMPTFLDVAGTEYSDKLRPLDGRSFLTGDPEVMFFQLEYPGVYQKAVIDWPWKVWFDSSNGWKLFNLENDPAEADDLAAQNPEKLQQLISKYETFDRAAVADQKKFKQTQGKE